MSRRSDRRHEREDVEVEPRRRRLIDYPRVGRRGLRRWIPSKKLIFGGTLLGAFLVVGGFTAAVALTPIPEANDVARAETTIVYWNDGKTELGRLGEANRISIPLSAMPTDLQHAVLAAEDRDFYNHGGFDPGAIARAAWNDVSGGDTQGGSTITQQYAKNAFLTQEQTMSRKVRELVLSVKLETQASKEQILENYLNTVYFGHGSYGVDAASRAYFRVPPNKLNLGQVAALAAIIRAPSGYDPDRHAEKLRERWVYVLDGMVTSGWITSAQRDKAKFPKFAKYAQTKNALAGSNGYLLESVEREMLRRGYTQNDLDLGGYRIVTTFDKDAQDSAVSAIESEAPNDRDRFLRLGLASVRPGTGEVVAMYGGSDYLKNQLSDADQAIALAGSTFKPFALAAALERGIELNSTWDGSSPRRIRGYKLENYGNESFGQISLLRATEKSVNTVYVDMAGTIGTDAVMQSAIRAGVPADTVGLGADPTTVLGTASPTALDMANAYATFAARGVRAEPTTIKSIARNNGGIEYSMQPKTERVYSESVADTVNYALRKVVSEGTGFAARGLGRPAAGKTGTTDNNRSAWFVGYTPQLATAVMMARSDKAGNSISLSGTGGMSSVTGGSFPARIWTAYMSGALSDEPEEDFVDPDGMSSDWGFSYSQPSPSASSSSASPRPSRSSSGSAGTSAPPSGAGTPTGGTGTATAHPPTATGGGATPSGSGSRHSTP